MMPPWHADPAIGHFSNERRLTDAQKSTIVRWVEAGAPEGDPKDLPAPPQYAQGWRIGKPDAVLSMQEDYPIPASGEIPYLYFEVPANFDEDRWIKSWEMRPGNPAVVHHVIVYVKPPTARRGAPAAARCWSARPQQQPVITFADGMDIPAGQTGGPPLPEGERKPPFPNYRPRPRGVAGIDRRLRARQLHARRSPRAPRCGCRRDRRSCSRCTTRRSARRRPIARRVGLIFAKEPPKMRALRHRARQRRLHIPGRRRRSSRRRRDDAQPRPAALQHDAAHARARQEVVLRGDLSRMAASETLLSVPNYDFEWQHEYQFYEPKRLPAGTKVHAIAWYDNSKANKSNPDPTKDVWWGDQTWEEMMFTAFTFHVLPAQTAAGAEELRTKNETTN